MWLGYLYPKGYFTNRYRQSSFPPTRRAESHDAYVVLVASDFYGDIFRVGEDRLREYRAILGFVWRGLCCPTTQRNLTWFWAWQGKLLSCGEAGDPETNCVPPEP